MSSSGRPHEQAPAFSAAVVDWGLGVYYDKRQQSVEGLSLIHI